MLPTQRRKADSNSSRSTNPKMRPMVLSRSNSMGQFEIGARPLQPFLGPQLDLGERVGALYGKTRERVPYSAFFEGRRSLGSRRLKCRGFGLQHL